jgi:hypothetical protein
MLHVHRYANLSDVSHRHPHIEDGHIALVASLVAAPEVFAAETVILRMHGAALVAAPKGSVGHFFLPGGMNT